MGRLRGDGFGPLDGNAVAAAARADSCAGVGGDVPPEEIELDIVGVAPGLEEDAVHVTKEVWVTKTRVGGLD